MSVNKRQGGKPKGAVRAKSGCYTCRIRRKKCDEKPDAEGSCQTCVRLRLQCLGFGVKRPEWMREGNSVVEMRSKIKGFLAQNGMIKGHSGPSMRSLSVPGAGSSSSANAAGPSSSSNGNLPPLTSVLGSSTSNGLSTPLSATSTLTPDDGSVSPPSPSSPQSYSRERAFPTAQDPMSPCAHSSHQVLVLSDAHPIPARPEHHDQPLRPSRRSAYSSAIGGSVSGTGYSRNGLDLTIDNTMSGHDASNEITNDTRCGTYTSNYTSFGRPYSASAIGSAHSRPSPLLYPLPSCFSTGTGTSASSASAASRSNYSRPRGHSSTALPIMNSISNAMDVPSSVSGYASSNASTPPMPSRGTPLTPYTPHSLLPGLPATHINGHSGMDWIATPSSSASTSRVMSTTDSDTDLLSPTSDSVTYGFDMDTRWAPGHHTNTRPGMFHGCTSNGGPGTNAPDIRVKTEPDVVGVDVVYNMDDSIPHVYTPYRVPVPLCPRASFDDGCTTPNPNSYPNTNVGPAYGEFATVAPLYNNNNTNTNNTLYSFASNSTSTNSDSFNGFAASASMGNHQYGMYPSRATAVDNSRGAPELSPDSPPPNYRHADSMLYGGSGHLSGHTTGNVSVAYHPPGQFAQHSTHVRYGGGGAQAGHSHDHGYGTGHVGQTTASSSWTGNNQVRLTGAQEQEQLLQHQQQSQAQYLWTHANHSNDSGLLQFPNASPTVRRTDLLPPSLQSSFGPLYYSSLPPDEFSMDMETYGTQMNGLGLDTTSAMMPYYAQTQAPISAVDFNERPQDLRQQLYTVAMQPLQSAPMDPMYMDRGDGSLVEHYLRYVRPVQYFFLDERLVDLLRNMALVNDAVRNAICSVASVHKRRMREGNVTVRGQTPKNALLALPQSLVDAPEGDDDTYYRRTEKELQRLGPNKLGKAEAMAGLQCISSFLFAGGVGGWAFFLNIACSWVGSELARHRTSVGDALLLDRLAEDELGSFIVRTTMWFEVLASVTMVQPPKFLEVYRILFVATDCGRIVEVDGESGPTNASDAKFSMLHVMGCDNLTFLALAEISALAAWKETETKSQTLSMRELVKRGLNIELRYLQAIPKTDSSVRQEGAGLQTDSLDNRRKLTADIFRASARLYLYTVLNGDKPSVPEIQDGVRETIEALQRVPVEPKSLRRSVVRSVVFPICLAGCMTDEGTERATLKQFLESEGGAGNCESVVAVMETVWEERDLNKRGGRAGTRRGTEHAFDVSWRDVLRERGGGVPILLV